ncbi:MAG TPA: DUF1287 domain-containing protein [Kofleriaceae bacterium]|nr:DUF1287 domain-containing protein [Kofleriaceae bacterium]
MATISISCAAQSSADADPGREARHPAGAPRLDLTDQADRPSPTGRPGPTAPTAGISGAASGPGAPATSAAAATPPAVPEANLGVADKGIWSDLDDHIQITLPAGLTADQVTARIDAAHHLLVLSIDGVARKAYPLGGPAALSIGDQTLALRPGDRAELAPLLTADHLTTGAAAHDRDGDGIPDPLDLLIGAKKTVANADAYTAEAEQYISMRYPMGDVPRTIGVCTDVIIRAVRNAGIDIQKELHEDIRRARTAYPMVKGAGDPSIDQRRVGTLLPYFQRHWESHTPKLDDPADPLRPGDIILMDTFPSRPGPDHIGILSDHVDAQGLPLVINNWTDGTVTAEMDLLTFVPVLYRFRLPQ